ncbi:hypothetical protein HFP72_22420 [Nocardiopsis sp. ARC36]|jgi:hypothetical protein
MNRPAYWAGAVALALALSVGGCGAPGESEDARTEDTMNQDEAATRVTEHIEGVVAALPEGAELEPRQGMNVAACDDPTDGGPRDRVTVSERLWIRGLPVEDNEANTDLMVAYWTDNGYEVVMDERPDNQSVTVRHTEDSFNVSLRVTDQGSLSLAASSPCVWPEGAPGS